MEDSWRKYEDEGLYFLNQNINKRGIEPDTTDFSKKNKLLWIVIPLIALSLVCIGIIMFTRSIIISIPAVFASLWLYIFILRKKVFDENLYARLNSENELYSKFGMDGPFNNLLKINDDNGQWFYQNSDEGLRTAFLVTFDYSSILDQSLKANENTIDQAIIPFIKGLHDNRLSFQKYSISINESISVGTLELIKRAKMLPEGSWLRLIETLQNDTISSLEQNAGSSYKTFFLVYNNDFKNVTRFRELLETIINSSLTSVTSISNPRICMTEEIVDFLVNYYQIDSFNEKSIVRNVQRMDISKFFDFVAFIDSNGAEYSLTDIIDFDENEQYLTDDMITSRVESYDKKKKMDLQKKQKIKEKEESQRLAQILRQQAIEKQKKEPNKKAQSFGIINNNISRDKMLEVEKVKKNKAKQIDQEKQRQDQIKKEKDAAKSDLDFNDSISIQDLLNSADKLDNKGE